MTSRQKSTGKTETATIGFTELASTDSEASRRFLEKAFKWKFQEVQMPSGKYLTYRSADGGTLGIRSTQRSESPTSMNYLRVEDLGSAEKLVVNAGGTIVLPRTDVPGMGSFFWFKVPSGPLMACWQDERKPAHTDR